MRTAEEIAADAADERAFSNHSEYEVWAARYCYECAHDDPETDKFCPILSAALLGQWPKEWTRREVPFTSTKGVPMSYECVDTCTEFEQRRDNGGGDDPPPDQPPPWDPEMPGQVDMFEVFVEQGIEHLTAPVPAATGGAR